MFCMPDFYAGSVVGLTFLCLHLTGENLGTYSASCRYVEKQQRMMLPDTCVRRGPGSFLPSVDGAWASQEHP